ncbi:MAG: hypothetical protein FWF69_00445 [Firmicutes bacterium]|nr:hypothetical protein [Bacillota bacterium]
MARRYAARRRKQNSTGGWLLTASVILLAVLACALISPPMPMEVAGVFSPGSQAAAAKVDSVRLPGRTWYLIEFEGRAMAACGVLLEAEITRGNLDTLASIRAVTAEEIDLRVTASAPQLAALGKCADALFHTFDTLERMAHLNEFDAMTTAARTAVELDGLCETLDKALAGSENPVVRGLAGLTGSCREAMVDLSVEPTKDKIQKKTASLVLQYEAYIAYLSGKNVAGR